jgi:phenylacetate-CoA ligase
VIASTFGCPVANGYGGRDAGFIAHQCPHGSMHITAEDVIVETVDADGSPVPAGKPGEIVVTHLWTADFPFIRYRTGDVGVLSEDPCGCGRGLPVLAQVHGRTTDFVVAQDGTVMHGLALIYVVRDLAGIETFKIIQESRQLVRVQLVKNGRYDKSIETALVEGFRNRLGRSVDVAVETVASIEAEASGKRRYVVSRVAA